MILSYFLRIIEMTTNNHISNKFIEKKEYINAIVRIIKKYPPLCDLCLEI